MRSTFHEAERSDGAVVRRVDSEEHEQLVVDFGPWASGADVDVLGDVVIVIGPDEEQVEIPFEGSVARTFMKNGVLSIEVDE